MYCNSDVEILVDYIWCIRPPWITVIFLQWLPWLLRMSRPGKTLTRKGILLETKLKELEKGDKQGNSLLAVLDMEDEIIPGTGPRTKSNQPTTRQPTKYSSLLDPDRWNFPNKVL